MHQGEIDQPAHILAEGWACSYKLVPDGGGQILDYQIPGEFLGLRPVLFRTADHNVEPVARIAVSAIKHADLLNIFADNPRLATVVRWPISITATSITTARCCTRLPPYHRPGGTSGQLVGVMKISTRRFWTRPVALEFEAIGSRKLLPV